MPNVKIQNIVLPEYDGENLVFPAELSVFMEGILETAKMDEGALVIPAGSVYKFTTYFNSISLERWKKYTYADHFQLKLRTKGAFELELIGMYYFEQTLEKHQCGEEEAERVFALPETDFALVGFAIKAITDVKLYSGGYYAEVSEDQLRDDIRISIATTTFKKEAFILKNVALLKNNILNEESDLFGHVFVHVVDNGRTLRAEEVDGKGIKLYPNPNVGGSGGYARGMIESLHMEQPQTHVLLMDDDVLILPEAIRRTYYLLRILREQYRRSFISGAMLDYDKRNMMYEDVGFVEPERGAYGPVKPHIDLATSQNGVVWNEELSKETRPDSYAGWWYCCIPVENIKEHGLPLPLFVRGDDVEYSLRCKAKFITMNGICIWHVGFATKFSAAMELYQVHRNSFIIQAASGVCPGAKFFKRISMQFLREITRLSYDNAEQILESVEDYLKGPEFLVHLNGEACMKDHSSRNEKQRPIYEIAQEIEIPVIDPLAPSPNTKFQKLFYYLTLNGHLRSDAKLNDELMVIGDGWNFSVAKNYMRKRLLVINSLHNTGYLRERDNDRCKALMKRFFALAKRYRKERAQVNAAYRAAFATMTSEPFWREYISEHGGTASE